MAHKDPEHRRAYMRELLQRRRAEVDAIKERGRCLDCDGQYPAPVMDFHHRDPTTKVESVGTLVARRRIKAALAEIEKCDLLCANCHRLREHTVRI